MKINFLTIGFSVVFAALILAGCKKATENPENSTSMNAIQISDYGVTANGDSIKTYTLTNKTG